MHVVRVGLGKVYKALIRLVSEGTLSPPSDVCVSFLSPFFSLIKLFCPMSESLSGKREGFQDNAIHKKGSLLLTRVRVFCRNQRSGAGSEEP